MGEFPLAHADGILIGFAVVVALFVGLAWLEMLDVVRQTREENEALRKFLGRDKE